MKRYMTIRAMAIPCRQEHTTSRMKLPRIWNGVDHKKMNYVPFYSAYSRNIDLNSTIVTASLNIPSPNTMEYSLGNFLDDIAYSEAIVSMLQKQAPKSNISQMDNSRIILISLASLTRSILNKQI